MIKILARRIGTTGYENNDTFRNFYTFNETGVDLTLAECGYEKCDPCHFWAGKKGFHVVHTILSGKGTLEVEGKVYHLSEGMGFYLSPDQEVHYTADADDPWEYQWVGFTGTRAVTAIQCTNLESVHVFPVQDKEKLKTTAQSIYDYACMSTDYGDFMALSCLYAFMAELIRTQSVNVRAETAGMEYVDKALELIRENYDKPFGVDELCKELRLSRSYVYKLFQRRYHISPSDYLMRYRLSKARELLLAQPCSIQSVVDKCCFCSHAYFSKRFKEYYGLTPKEFVKKARKEEAAT